MNKKRVGKKKIRKTKRRRIVSSRKKEQLSKKIEQVFEKSGQPLLEYFYEYPSRRYTVRELSLLRNNSPSTTHYWLQNLKRKGIITEENGWKDTWQNRLRKTLYYVEKIAESGLVDYLEQELAASAIILFGSFRKGESVRDSDIDLFVECARIKKLDLHPFEKKLGHKIQLFIEPKITRLPTHLLNNVINGIKLKGYFTIK